MHACMSCARRVAVCRPCMRSAGLVGISACESVVIAFVRSRSCALAFARVALSQENSGYEGWWVQADAANFFNPSHYIKPIESFEG